MLPHRRRGFTLVEVTIVLAIIGIIIAIALPTWLRQREISRGTTCQENLTKIDGAVEAYATEFKLPNGAAINYPNDLLDPDGSGASNHGYLRSEPRCPSSGSYTVAAIGEAPTCSIGATLPQYPPHQIP